MPKVTMLVSKRLSRDGVTVEYVTEGSVQDFDVDMAKRLVAKKHAEPYREPEPEPAADESDDAEPKPKRATRKRSTTRSTRSRKKPPENNR